MTKADWLDFFEAINVCSATEEQIAATLAAGEFQDDAPAVEAAPVQEAPAQPIFAGA
ncbi:DNA primase [Streptococcus thermophilus]|nr:DNA primase [Streptococcus thermophilus]CAD0140353.1 DNA primase [Streptococcus thermophilus]CAD0146119.1 DNA primase [Streptococcus thermophilus]